MLETDFLYVFTRIIKVRSNDLKVLMDSYGLMLSVLNVCLALEFKEGTVF